MIKKSLFCGVLGLSIPFLVASCADLRDADRCYRLARLTCQKSCDDPDTDHCIETLKNACHHADAEEIDETWLDECSTKLAELDDCVGNDAVIAACADRSDQIGAKCSSTSDCADGQTCMSGMCTTSCYYDSGCERYTTVSGGRTYCNGMNDGPGVCIGVCQSDSQCSNGWVCQPNGEVRTCGPDTSPDPGPTPTGVKLGDPCDSTPNCGSNTTNECSLGYCTKSCQSQSACSGTTSDGGTLACARLTAGAVSLCLPSCASTSDCATGSVCRSLSTPEGLSRMVCFEDPMMMPATGTKLFGQACSSATECRDTGSRCDGYCTKTCVNDSECSTSSGSRSAGRCVSGVNGGSKFCMPGCSPGISGQCEGNSSCVVGESTSGPAYVCRPGSIPVETGGGRVGDECETRDDCNQNDALECSFGMCTKTCSLGSSCPEANDFSESICASIISNGPTSVTGCTITCGEQDCLPGWSCTYDPNVGVEVCKHAL